MSDLPPSPEPSPLEPSPYSPALAVTGLLMIGAVFAFANPFFGTSHQVWPWQMLAQGNHSLRVEVVFMLWMATGFWCLASSLAAGPKVRAVGAAMLGVPLLFETTSRWAGLTIEHVNLVGMVAMILLGGGLLAARAMPSRRVGAILAGVGGALLIWSLATAFPKDAVDSNLARHMAEVATVLQDPTHEFDRPNHFWWDILPRSLILIGAAWGLLAFFGVRNRRFLAIGFWILAAGVAAPGIAGTVLTVMAGNGLKSALEQILGMAIGGGALIWMLGAFTIEDFARVPLDEEVA